MPIYEFICQSCQTEFEKLTSFDWKSAGVICPGCDSNDLLRAVSMVGRFKTSGAPSYSGAPNVPAPASNSACSSCSSSSCKTCH